MIAVAGSTGYIGGLLCMRLREDGVAVRALARDPDRAEDLAAIGCEVQRADVLEPGTLAAALEGAEVACYLVHSMGRGSDGDYAERDRRAARNFAVASAVAGVQRIVYLGGLGEGSKHLDSRHATAEILREGQVPVAYLRAAAVIGAGSESFRTVYYLVRRLPLRITVPVLTPALSSLWIGLVTPVDTGVARPLVEGLETETVVTDRSGMELLGAPVRTPLREALAQAAEATERASASPRKGTNSP